MNLRHPCWSLALLLLLLGWAGCASTPRPDWTARIGQYTYDQAVLDYGPPDRSEVLSDGTRVARWYRPRSGGFSLGVGTGISSGNVGVGVGQAVTPGRGYRVMQLTFDPEGRLAAHAGAR